MGSIGKTGAQHPQAISSNEVGFRGALTEKNSSGSAVGPKFNGDDISVDHMGGRGFLKNMINLIQNISFQCCGLLEFTVVILSLHAKRM